MRRSTTDVQHSCFGLSVKETMLFANEERQQLSALFAARFIPLMFTIESLIFK